MNTYVFAGLLAALPCCVFAQYNMGDILVKAQRNAPIPEGDELQWDAGGDFRVRQEIMQNLPDKSKKGGMTDMSNYFRMRARAWGKVENEDFTLYGRLVDEFREYIRSSYRNYGKTPGEVIPDNLYLDLRNILWDRVDLRIGRQELMYGAGRIFMEGTPMDGSRSFYSDAVKAVIKIDEENTLDVFGLYNSPYSFGWRDPDAYGPYDTLALNGIEPWSRDMAEWGTGLYYRNTMCKEIPFEVYYVYADKSNYELVNGTRMQGRWLNTVGARVMPQLTEEWSMEFEGAGQYGQRYGGAEVGGLMGYAGLTYAPKLDIKPKTYATLSTLYLSGDKDRGTGREGDDEADRSWDPLWSRYTYFLSEMYAYEGFYGICYWSNMFYPNLEVGAKWPNKHAVFASVGPMMAAVQDGAGGGDGMFHGVFERFRYDFPLWNNIFGTRTRLFGHATLEVLQPGDYTIADKTAYFARWEVSIAF